MPPTQKPKVLIIGAGPTGLVLALWLTAQHIPVTIIDKSQHKESTSRAMAVHARTLELYRQLDLAEEVVAQGHKIQATNIWSNGSHRTRLTMGDVGEGLTPYPFIHSYPQDRHERVLEGRLHGMGVFVRRECEVLGVEELGDGEGVSARVRGGDGGEEVIEAEFLAGCDGAHSVVRRECGIGFEGAMYEQVFFVADFEGTGRTMNGEAHVSFNDADFALLLAYDEGHRARIAGAIDDRKITKELSELRFEDIEPHLTKTMKLEIEKVNWFTTYRTHHRLAEAFRRGRVFLAGDAAHIHSPVGGQGMNTGIGDAINLAWKLAAVLQGRADASLLDSYEVERRAFANSLVQTTDWAFNWIVGDGYIVSFFRSYVIPYLVPYLASLAAVRKKSFSRTSQILIEYRHSDLSAGVAGTAHGGDRVPWAPVGDVDNFDSLKEITWQVHVYGDSTEELEEWCVSKGVPLHVFAWNEKYEAAGLARNAAYLIRPDTYIAVAEPSGLPARFDQYLQDISLQIS